jgi:hypothetical protein
MLFCRLGSKGALGHVKESIEEQVFVEFADHVVKLVEVVWVVDVDLPRIDAYDRS